MTSLSVVPPVAECWNRIGIRGDRSCPELERFLHCHNCPVFAAAGRRFLDMPAPAGYVEEWTERLAAPPEEPPTDLQSALVFRLADEWLALPVRVLVEVAGLRPVHRIPHRGGLLAGLVNIRGELHLCLRLDGVLGIRRKEEPGTPDVAARARLLLVQRDGERWVFPVDEVDRVCRYPAGTLAAVPATVGRSLGRLTRGVLTREGRSVGCLDDERLFQTLRAKLR